MNEDRQQTPIEGHAVSEEGHEVYQIRVKNHLNDSWSEWFEGLTITHEEDGITVLTGPVADQPALHGLLVKIRDLGLPLVSVNQAIINENEEGKSDE
ncbi:MAG: hypothetical protein ACE5LU_17800 [Anaerolineae bacterium]